MVATGQLKGSKATAKKSSGNNTTRKIVAAGRGRVIQHPNMRNEIIKLARKNKPHVVYLGTATFDSDSAYDSQAAGFVQAGCTVEKLKVTTMKPTLANKQLVRKSIEGADIIAVSGGNTLFTINKWKKLGMQHMLKKAMENGTVLCGGSCGAICWFDAGHSDSRDPTTVLHTKPK